MDIAHGGRRAAEIAALLLAACLILGGCRGEPDPGDGGAPEPVQVTGVADGVVYDLPVTPMWSTAAGTTDDATLIKDLTPVSAYERGDVISDGATYSLLVITTKTSNGLTAPRRVDFMIAASLPSEEETTNSGESGAELDVYVYGGSEFAQNPMYTMWVEDMSGGFLQDLLVTTAAGTNIYPFTAGFVARPMSVPYWAHKACTVGGYETYPTMYLALPTADGGPDPDDLDAVTAATRKANFVLHTRRHADGVTQFKVLFEINRSRDYNDTYTEAGFDPGGQPSLVYAATIDLGSAQQFYTLSLLGSGQPLGDDGVLHGTGDVTTAVDMVDKIVVRVGQ
jgi:hypothetical protein